MNNEAQFETTAIIDIDAELKEQEKQKELLNTIKMEPILEKTVMEEETPVTKKKKMMEITDYIQLVIRFVLKMSIKQIFCAFQ